MKLSVVLVSYNSFSVLPLCLKYLKQRLEESLTLEQAEIIVVDNASTDKTVSWLKQRRGVRTIFLKKNTGFSAGNNTGLLYCRGKYVLFLNTDVYLKTFIDFKKLFAFLEARKMAAGLTIKLLLPSGQIDPASHRGFPTPINAGWYFCGLEKLTAKIPVLNRLFGGYHLTYKDLETVHKISSATAAFLLLKKKVLAKVEGFDPDYFFYGEDLDLCYRISKLGYSIWYYPFYTGYHLKYQSGQKSNSVETKRQAQKYFYKTMCIFYDKHYQKKYPRLFSALVRFVIRQKEKKYENCH